jgi:hypothetical protein
VSALDVDGLVCAASRQRNDVVKHWCIWFRYLGITLRWFPTDTTAPAITIEDIDSLDAFGVSTTLLCSTLTLGIRTMLASVGTLTTCPTTPLRWCTTTRLIATNDGEVQTTLRTGTVGHLESGITTMRSE